MQIRLVIVLLLALLCAQVHAFDGPQVMTPFGGVQGIIDSATGSNVFYGVPYAQPPIGGLRFVPPQPVAPWGSLLNATTQPPACPQKGGHDAPTGQSEDCLVMNIYVPPGPVNESRYLPVRVWIHGGVYTHGSAAIYPAEKLCAESGTIVVVLQYRLGALGFAYYSPFNASQANLGFKDQTLALQFVQQIIPYFGGDINRVMINGESAGGAAIVYHLLSSRSCGLYSRAIAESPAGWEYVLPSKIAHKLDPQLKTLCGTEDLTHEQLMKCLQSLPLSTLIENEDSGIAYNPVVDGEDIVGSPLKMIFDGHICPNISSIMLGNQGNEGSIFAYVVNGNSTDLGRIEYDAITLAVAYFLPNVSIFQIDDNYDEVADKEGYFNALSLILTHGFVECGMLIFANHTTRHGIDTYIYKDVHAPELTPLPAALGAYHGSELQFVFNTTIEPIAVAPNELPLVAAIDNAWLQYHLTGSPPWAPWPAEAMQFDNPTSQIVKSPPVPEQCYALWEEVLYHAF